MVKVICLWFPLTVLFSALLAAATLLVPALVKFSTLIGMAWGCFSMLKCMDIGYKRGWIK